MILAHVGKLLPQACHLEAKQCGVVEVEQFPQREQDGRAVSALLQAQTKEKLFKLSSIVLKALSRLAPLVRTAAH